MNRELTKTCRLIKIIGCPTENFNTGDTYLTHKNEIGVEGIIDIADNFIPLSLIKDAGVEYTYLMSEINCKEIREEIIKETKHLIQYKKLHPVLAVIQIGDDKASSTYIKNKNKTCAECGIECIHVKLPEDIPVEDIPDEINRQARNKNVNGVILQLPLPDHLKPYQQDIIELIPQYKDVDGITTANIGYLWSNGDGLVPATALGVMSILDHSNIDLKGKHVVLIGRSNLCNIPLTKMLLDKDATVTVLHSKSKDIKKITRKADILITAIGKPKFITSSYTKNGVFMIDVGINRDENGKLCGDIDIDSFKFCEGCYTPVPGGVGILTTAHLALNTAKACAIQKYLTNNINKVNGGEK